jgi:hypothetical protein
MDFDPKLLIAWAQRDEAERALSQILQQLIPSTTESLRVAVGASPDDEDAAGVMFKGQAQPVYVRKKRVLIRFHVRRQERFWIQFYARRDGTAIFSAEVRYQDPKRQLSPPLAEVTQAARELDVEHGKDEFGHSWKLPAIQPIRCPPVPPCATNSNATSHPPSRGAETQGCLARSASNHPSLAWVVRLTSPNEPPDRLQSPTVTGPQQGARGPRSRPAHPPLERLKCRE